MTTSAVTFTAAADTDYYVAVDGVAGATGTVVIALPPVNDDLADALELTTPSFSFAASTHSSSTETAEPDHASAAFQSTVWCRYTPTRTGQQGISASSADCDPLIAVYEGDTMATLRLIAANNDAPGLGKHPQLQFFAEADHVYRIALASAGSSTGTMLVQGSANTLPLFTGPPSVETGFWATGATSQHLIVGDSLHPT